MKHILILLNIVLFVSAQAQYGLFPGEISEGDAGGHYEFFMSEQPWFGATFDSSFADWQVNVGQEVVLRKRLKTDDTLKLNIGGMATIQCKAVFYRGTKKYVGHCVPICFNGMDDLDGIQEIPEEPLVSPPVAVIPPIVSIDQGVLHLSGNGVLVLQNWPLGSYEFLAFSGNLELGLPYEHNRIQVLWDDFPVTDMGVIKK